MKLEKTGDGSLTLYSEHYGQTFHSLHGAVTESRHVFVEGAGIGERLRQSGTCRVLEVGFGTGLNCFLTADVACAAGARLDLISLEKDLLPAAALRELEFTALLAHPELLERYLDFREALPEQVTPGDYTVPLGAGVSLTIKVGQAPEQVLPVNWADAVYHDAFSPDANPDLWSGGFLQKLHGSLAPGGKLVSYSVKGSVRRALSELGFTVTRQPGPPGGKRQMLVAQKT